MLLFNGNLNNLTTYDSCGPRPIGSCGLGIVVKAYETHQNIFE